MRRSLRSLSVVAIVAAGTVASGASYASISVSRGLVHGCCKAAPASPIVAMSSTPDGKGYWLVTAKGHVYHYGDAKNWGSVT